MRVPVGSLLESRCSVMCSCDTLIHTTQTQPVNGWPPLPFPQPRSPLSAVCLYGFAVPCLPSVCMDLPVVDISYEQNHALHALL